jgi:leucyl aminopeptidase
MKIAKIRTLRPGGADAIVVPLFRGLERSAVTAEFPELAPLLKDKELFREGGELFCHSLNSRRLFLVIAAGSGRNRADARKLARRVMSRLEEKRLRRALLYVPSASRVSRAFWINLIDYLHLNHYRFDRYQGKKRKPLQRLDLFCERGAPLTAADIAARETIQHSVSFCRDLVNEIPARVTPDSLVQAAAALAEELGLALRIYRREELAAHRLHGLLAVGAAAAHPPALIRLDYVPAQFSRRVSLVGKGITFDAGGLNIKPGNSMEEMKSDMAGAAVVLAAIQAAARLRLPVQVTAWAAVAENMPGGGAYKPGDIIAYANKKTVEIVNTDAEGRLILADALIMAAREKPDAIIELSTLTGAIFTALGDGMAGLMCRNGKLRSGLLQAAEASGELLWELPLFSDYRRDITSKVADLKNANYRGASSIKAGLFLSEFTGGAPFAHLDIAGTAFLSKPGPWLNREGATGFGVRLLVQFLQDLKQPG